MLELCGSLLALATVLMPVWEPAANRCQPLVPVPSMCSQVNGVERLVHRETEMARLKLQDEVEGLQIRLAQVLDGTAASINEDNLMCATQAPFLGQGT